MSASRWRVVVDVARDGGVRCFHRKSGHTSRRLLVVVLLHCSRGRARRTYVRTVRATTHACWARESREAERRSAATRATARAASPCPHPGMAADDGTWGARERRAHRQEETGGTWHSGGGKGSGSTRLARVRGVQGQAQQRAHGSRSTHSSSSRQRQRQAGFASLLGPGLSRQAGTAAAPFGSCSQLFLRRSLPPPPPPSMHCRCMPLPLPLLVLEKKTPHTHVALHHHVPPTTYMTLSTVLASRYGNTVLVTRCLATIHRTNRNFIVVTFFFLCVYGVVWV